MSFGFKGLKASFCEALTSGSAHWPSALVMWLRDDLNHQSGRNRRFTRLAENSLHTKEMRVFDILRATQQFHIIPFLFCIYRNWQWNACGWLPVEIKHRSDQYEYDYGKRVVTYMKVLPQFSSAGTKANRKKLWSGFLDRDSKCVSRMQIRHVTAELISWVISWFPKHNAPQLWDKRRVLKMSVYFTKKILVGRKFGKNEERHRKRNMWYK
jgi:hypothetical protein